MCYCSNAEETLGKSIAYAETRITQLESDNKEDLALTKQLESELAEAKASRTEAKETIAQATT
jgi:hypothetical protein